MRCNAGYEWCNKHHAVVYKDSEHEYCVFHAPKDKKGIAVDAFNALVFTEINNAIKENRSCELSGTVFPGDISFFDVRDRLPKIIDFSEAQFSGRAKFLGAKFDRVYFYKTRFCSMADFTEAKFNGHANFPHVIFEHEAVFWDAQFIERVGFGDARFEGAADFLDAIFKESAIFERSVFRKGVNFERARIKFADFSETIFKESASFKELFIDGQGKVRFHNVNLEKASFRGTDLRLCDFITCDWKEKDGRYIIYDEDEYREEWNHRIFKPDERINRIKDIENLYRTLKQETKAKHDEFSYSHWHYSEKEMQLERTTIKNPFYWFALHFYKWSSGFGEEPKRAGGWLLGLIIASFLLIGSVNSSFGWEEARITIDYLTFRKPDGFSPTGWIGFAISLVSHILVPIQATLFGFALRNRFRR